MKEGETLTTYQAQETEKDTRVMGSLRKVLQTVTTVRTGQREILPWSKLVREFQRYTSMGCQPARANIEVMKEL